LQLCSAGGVSVGKFLLPDELDRKSTFRPIAALSCLMLGDTLFELVSAAEIIVMLS